MAKFGVNERDWRAARHEITEILIARAKSKPAQTISYSELASQIRSLELHARDPRLDALLDEISEEQHEIGRGMLSVLVVHKDGSQMPGAGFFQLARTLGHEVAADDAFWIDELRRVVAAWCGDL